MNKADYEAGETEEEKKEIEERENGEAYFIFPLERDVRYTKEGLPILTNNTKRAFKSELERSLKMRENNQERIMNWLDEINEENPEIVDFMSCVVSTYPDELKFRTGMVLIELYKLLKSQTTNNTILDYFEIGENLFPGK